MFISAYSVLTSILAFLMTSAFFYANRIRKIDIVDVVWGIGFLLVAWYTFLISSHAAKQLLVTGLITIWGLRLSLHIYARSKGKPEDPRYTAFRNKWKTNFLLKSYFILFLFQGLLILLISTPVILINLAYKPLINSLDLVALLFWSIGFLFEALGDYQLSNFIKKNVSQAVMDQGVWRYTRHPNYFGEIIMWWSIFLMGLTVPFGLGGIISPLIICYLLLYLSGIPMLEKRFDSNPAYQEYKKRTSPLIPWFPKK